MGKLILGSLCLMFIGLSFAADCGVNSQGNKHCTYDNGCYEYWNKNGTHYSSCNKPSTNNDDLVNMIKKEMNDARNNNEEQYYITSEQEEAEQKERDIYNKQWIEKKIKEEESAHVMSFGEIVFYIIVAFVFTLVVIMPAKDAFWPKK